MATTAASLAFAGVACSSDDDSKVVATRTAAEACRENASAHHVKPASCGARTSSAGAAKGDFNADGIADLAIGAPFESVNGVVEAGAVHVIYGSLANGLDANGTATHPEDKVISLASFGQTPHQGDHFGAALASPDLNPSNSAGAFDDLVIGIPGFNTNDGRVIAVPGTAQGLVTSGSPGGANPGRVLYNGVGDELAGSSLAWADFDGDEKDDVAIGSPGFSLHPAYTDYDPERKVCVAKDVNGGGKVTVTFGLWDQRLNASAPQAIHQEIRASNSLCPGNQSPRGLGFSAFESGDHFGEVITAGDMDGVALAELVVGVPDEDVRTGNRTAETSNAGAVQVVYSEGGFLNHSHILLQGADGDGPTNDGAVEEDDGFGSSLSIGNFDSSPRVNKDLAVGASNETIGSGSCGQGAVFVYYNWSTERHFDSTAQELDQGTDGIFGEPQCHDEFGGALTSGDFNGDGRGDLVVGSPGEDFEGITNAGYIHVLYGVANSRLTGTSSRGFSESDFPAVARNGKDDFFGSTLTAWNFGLGQTCADPPDLCGAITDLAIGAPLDSTCAFYGGAVIVLYGRTGGLSATGAQQWTPNTPEVAGDCKEYARFGGALY